MSCVHTTGGRVCSEVAVGWLTVGCEHEHIVSNPFCGGHAQYWRQASTDAGAQCEPCYNGRKPHECLLREIAWQPAVVTA
jgi:hypothetical protein